MAQHHSMPSASQLSHQDCRMEGVRDNMQENSDFEPLREYVFMHIPKTGGTSIRKAVVTALQEKEYQMVYDYQSNPLDTPWLPAVERNEKAAMVVRKHFPRADKLLICGHFNAARYLNAFHPQSFFCLLREPFDIVYSIYNHQRRIKGLTDSFEDFITRPAYRDRQSKCLTGLSLEDIGFFGLLENIENEVAGLSRFLGAKLIVEHSNIGDYDTDKHEMREKWHERVRQLNEADCRLFEDATRLKQDQSRQENKAKETAAGIGHCRWSSPNQISGWASVTGGNKMATVVLVDGSKRAVAEARADHFRKDLKLRGRIRHGVAGFSFSIPDGVERSNITVIIKETGQILIPVILPPNNAVQISS